MVLETAAPEGHYVQVRVWFGQFAIIDRTASAALGAEFAETMRQRFSVLRITTDPAIEPTTPSEPASTTSGTN